LSSKFPTGDAFKSSEEALAAIRYAQNFTFTVEDAERQMILLALAELSIARPGWIDTLESIALKMDNRNADGHAEMFERFRRNHSDPVAEQLKKS